MPPGAVAATKSSASSISGPARMLAIEEVERRARRQRRMRHAVGDRQREFAPLLAKRQTVQRGIIASDVDADGIDVGGDGHRFGPQRHCAKRQQPGARADIGDPLKAFARRSPAGPAPRGTPRVV